MSGYKKTDLVNGITIADAMQEFQAANYKGELARLSSRGIERFGISAEKYLTRNGSNHTTEFSTHCLRPSDKVWMFLPEKHRLTEVFQYRIENRSLFSSNKISIVTEDWFENDEPSFLYYLKHTGSFLLKDSGLVEEDLRVAPVPQTLQFVIRSI